MSVRLNSGHDMPLLSFGTYDIKPAEVKPAIDYALSVGYRHIDAAALYGNEEQIGEALADNIARGVVTRAELYITTKVWQSNFRHVREACLGSMRRLKVDYLDQYLLHWPFAIKPKQAPGEVPLHDPNDFEFDNFPLQQAWVQMEELVDEGLVRSIGISNWTVALTHDLLTYARIKPAVNQFEASPYFPRNELIGYLKSRDILPVIYRVLFSPPQTPDFPFQVKIQEDPVVVELAQKYQRTPGQILINWGLSKGCSVPVKSITPSRILENFEASNFRLEAEEVERLNHLPIHGSYNDTEVNFKLPLYS
jgi:diketogulonate reductase-like aldo/keto reductase